MTQESISILTANAVSLLQEMIAIPAYSSLEQERAAFLYTRLTARAAKRSPDITVERIGNNLLLYTGTFDNRRETVMLCSHIDTVKESAGYTFNPFLPFERDENIYGLGTNDDGASVVCQIETFFALCARPELTKRLPVNLILVIGAEEECSGKNGMDRMLRYLSEKTIRSAGGGICTLTPHFAIVGEPTGMKAAVAERGLLVLDGVATGTSGHAARNEGINALYKALDDIQKLRNFTFAKISPLMGEVKLTVTQLNSGHAHNVIPDKAVFTVDIRPTEQYSNPEIWELLQKEVESTLTPRNLTNRTSATPQGHRLLATIGKLGIESYVSPTTSDWMRLNIPAIKMGPGESARSHQADEYIKKAELRAGIEGYLTFLRNLQ